MLYLYLILSLVALGALAALAGRLRTEKPVAARPQTPPPSCCGQHGGCAGHSLGPHTHPHRQPDYYDDEELDRFRGTESNAYTEEEADEFREVLYTLRPGEAPAWLHSLQARGLDLPDSLKDEAFLFVNESPEHA
jgi:hypothetical protein